MARDFLVLFTEFVEKSGSFAGIRFYSIPIAIISNSIAPGGKNSVTSALTVLLSWKRPFTSPWFSWSLFRRPGQKARAEFRPLFACEQAIFFARFSFF